MTKNSAGLLLIAGVAMFGQTVGQTVADRKLASVQGVVTNSVTGEPVLRAHVVLRAIVAGSQSGQTRYGALTTTEGKFAITGMDPGRYAVAVDKTGFVFVTDSTPVALQSGDAKDDLKLKLTPAGSIAGRVLTPEGDPMENVAVTLDGIPNSTSTDDKGRFRIGGLTPGKYRVRATPQSMPVPEVRTDGTKEIYYAPTLYPSALLPAAATRVEARAGNETMGIDIRLVRTPIVRVSGSVAGLPAGAANLRAEARGEHFATGGGGMVKADGKFEIWKLNPGKYTVFASWNQAGGVRMQSTPAEIEVSDSNIDRILLNALPPIGLAGHVEYEDEKARPRQARISFSAREGYSSGSVEVGADGSFRLSDLSPTRYRFFLSWGPAYVKSMRLGPTQMDGSELDLRAGAAGGDLTLVVSSAMGDIAGMVTNGDSPAPDGTPVALLAADSDYGPVIRWSSSTPGGAYVMQAVPPGKYRIVAVHERSENLEDDADRMETIEVRANEKTSRDLKLPIR
ncbi:MAG TPA: carboxypeptidase-like regulatory domain-containing protein [Candidatus Sulfopaludibacter sp.]|jgi:uncharacterized protein (DUF2141 family)|nr:carboxypeptidase-like regulatory domain-containing protein [Candidatus Sulfopaludibacter sp.]